MTLTSKETVPQTDGDVLWKRALKSSGKAV